MLDGMSEQFAELPQWVGYWLNWMGLMLILSVPFAFRHKTARVAVALGPLAVFALAPVVFYFFGNIHLLGIAHFIAWTPLLIYIYVKEIRTGELNYKSLYGVWLMLFSATLIISLLFDARDIVLVAMGAK